MDEITCPFCGSSSWTCWDERQLTYWTPEGEMAGTQIIGCMKCASCGKAYAHVDPSDEVMEQGGNWTPDDERNSAYRTGW